MKRLLLTWLLIFVAGTASAQVVPSAYVPLAGNCALFDSSLLAASTAHLPIRGLCNVPEEANAVAVVVTADPAKDGGQLRLFDSGLPASSAAPLLEYPRCDPASTWAIVR